MTDQPIETLAAEMKAALVEAQSHTAYYAKTLIALRDTLLGVTGDIEDEGDRVYFGSSNDAGALKDIAGRIDDLAWEEIMADSQPPLNLYDAIERGNAEREALSARLVESEAREGALREALRSCETSLTEVVRDHPDWVFEIDRAAIAKARAALTLQGRG